MRNRTAIIYFTIYMLLGTAAVTVVQGQSPVVRPGEQQREQGRMLNQRSANENTLDVVVPRGQPTAISDWALAGVVWSDACLVRKLARQAAAAASDEELAAGHVAVAERAERLITALEQFGWRRIARSPEAGSQLAKSRTESARENDSRPGPMNRPNRRPREVGGATLLPTEGPVELDLYQRNYRLEGAGDAEPEFLPPQVEKGMEEAIADSGILRSAEFGDSDGRISYRESQTRSGTMPYSYESIYDTDDYDPDVDYRNERPLVIADPIPPAERARMDSRQANDESDDVADMYGFEDRDQQREQDAELDPTPVTPSNLLDRLAGVSSIEKYTGQGTQYKRDSHWVQLHLNLNQMMWQNLAESGNWPEAMELATLKLANSAKLALTVTGNQRLKTILQRAE